MINNLLRTTGLIAIVPAIIAVAANMPWCMHCVH